MIPSIVEAILLIVQVLLDNMDKILEAAFAIIKGLAEGLLNALPELIDALPEIITTIIDFITDNLPEIIEMGIELTVQLAAGLIQAIPSLWQNTGIIAAIVTGLGKRSALCCSQNIVTGLWKASSLGSWIAIRFLAFLGVTERKLLNQLAIKGVRRSVKHRTRYRRRLHRRHEGR